MSVSSRVRLCGTRSMYERAFSIASCETPEDFGARLAEDPGGGKADWSAEGAGVGKARPAVSLMMTRVMSAPNTRGGWAGVEERGGLEGMVELVGGLSVGASSGGWYQTVFRPCGPSAVVMTIGVTLGRDAKILCRRGKNLKSFSICSIKKKLQMEICEWNT